MSNHSRHMWPVMEKLPRILAGGLFALFLAAITQALSIFGVIEVALGHLFMFVAWVAGSAIIVVEILPLKPTRHKIVGIVILGVLLTLIDLWAVHYKHAESAKAVDLIDSGLGVVVELENFNNNRIRHFWTTAMKFNQRGAGNSSQALINAAKAELYKGWHQQFRDRIKVLLDELAKKNIRNADVDARFAKIDSEMMPISPNEPPRSWGGSDDIDVLTSGLRTMLAMAR
jgi:hypothetical protein